MSLTSSASLIGGSGCLRSWVIVVVKPLTSSPAMPMTTWVGRKPAISSASWRATAQLSTTAAMSATVPDCMWLRPWRLRPTPRTVPWPVVVDLEHERLRELRADVERRAGGEGRGRRPGSRCGAGTPSSRASPRRTAARVTRRRRGRQPRRVPPRSRLRAPPGACPCPGPSRGARRPGHRSLVTAAWTSDPAAMPRATRSSLTVTNSCGSSASRPEGDHAATGSAPRTSLAKPLSASIDSRSSGGPDEPRRPARPPRRVRRGRRAWAGRPAPPCLAAAASSSRSSSWSAAIRSSSASGVRAPTAAAARSSARTARPSAGRRRRRSPPRCGASPSRCSARR